MTHPPMPEPLYAHDCDRCTFLGTFESHDLYHCMQGGHPTVIARFGSEGAQYTSGAVFADRVPAIAEAFRRARAAGLPPDTMKAAASEEYCHCGMLMDDHTPHGSCTSPRVMPMPEPTPPYPSCVAAARKVNGVYGHDESHDETIGITIDRTCRVSEREADHAHALAEAKRRVPDYPWARDTISEAVWALGESLNGVRMANDDLHKERREREEREVLLADAAAELRSLWEMFAVPGGIGELRIGDSVRRMHAMKLETLLARLDERKP